MILFLMLLQISSESALFYDDYVQSVNLGVEIDFDQRDWQHHQENISVRLARPFHFSTISVNTISLSFWPTGWRSIWNALTGNDGGVILVVIRACGHSIWRKSSYMPLFQRTLIIPADRTVRLRSPCDEVEVEVHAQGNIRMLFELAGMAAIE